jgi:hypothetical protein
VPKLTVPFQYRSALHRIALMSDDETRQLKEALAAARPTIRFPVLLAQVRGALTVDIPDLEDIIQALSGLSTTRFNTETPIEGVVADVASVILSDSGIGPPPKVDKALLEHRLASLLTVEPLVLFARANDVQHECPNLFGSARMLSDVRPLFGSNPKEIIGAMILHNLKITYYSDNEYKECYFVLDDADVAALRKVLDRAEAKTGTLEQVIDRSGLTYFESK